jgi:hypothetical protein
MDYRSYQRAGENEKGSLLSFILGLLGFSFCSCLMPLAPIFGVLSLLFAYRYIKGGGKWDWMSCFGVALGALAILFGIFLTVLFILEISRQNTDSIYGIWKRFFG